MKVISPFAQTALQFTGEAVKIPAVQLSIRAEAASTGKSDSSTQSQGLTALSTAQREKPQTRTAVMCVKWRTVYSRVTATFSAASDNTVTLLITVLSCSKVRKVPSKLNCIHV